MLGNPLHTWNSTPNGNSKWNSTPTPSGIPPHAWTWNSNSKEAHECSGILHAFVHGIPHVENELNGNPLLVEFQIVAFLSFYTVLHGSVSKERRFSA